MARISVHEAGGYNVVAFLDMLAYAEGTDRLGDDGYNALVGGTLFTGYDSHPHRYVVLNHYNICSTAAGRYQFLYSTWVDLAERCGLDDFSPLNQDKGAIELLSEARALSALTAGDIRLSITRCRHIWASLPGAGYAQRERDINRLLRVYLSRGGRLARQ